MNYNFGNKGGSILRDTCKCDQSFSKTSFKPKQIKSFAEVSGITGIINSATLPKERIKVDNPLRNLFLSTVKLSQGLLSVKYLFKALIKPQTLTKASLNLKFCIF